MFRTTKPELTIAENASEDQKARLALFLDLIHQNPVTMQAILDMHYNVESIQAALEEAKNPDTYESRALQSANEVLTNGDYLHLQSDETTAQAIQNNLENAGGDLKKRSVGLICLSTVVEEINSYNDYSDTVQPAEFRRPSSQPIPPTEEGGLANIA